MVQRIFFLIFAAWASFLGDGGGGGVGGVASAMRLTNMSVPLVQDPRLPMHLACFFDMGGEELYAVKWYKDDQEFYRYAPRRRGAPASHTTYPVDGVRVDETHSRCDRTACDLFLDSLRRPRSSGAYRCEVSSEAPAFRLASQTHNVTVAALPTELPVMEGLKESYTVGEYLHINCTSGFGDPKPTLKWYINDQHQKTKVKDFPPSTHTDPESGVNLTRATSQLRIVLDKSFIQPPLASTFLEVRCESSTEGVNSMLAPPLNTIKNAVLVDRAHLVNNQKLHWPNGASNRDSICYVVVIAYFVW